jgi:hypothetical protein
MNIAQQTALYGHLTFEESKARVAEWYAREREMSAIINGIPKHPNSWPVESAKTVAWRKAQADYRSEADRNRRVVAYHTRTFKSNFKPG